MADAFFQVVLLLFVGEVRRDVERGLGLADAGNVVQFALDAENRRFRDLARIDILPTEHHFALRQRMFLEHHLQRLQEIFRRQVHDRQVFFVERRFLVRRLVVAFDQMVEQLVHGQHVPFKVHGNEVRQLHEARQHAAEGPRIGRRHGGDDVLFEPLLVVFLGQLVDRGLADPGIDRPTHQGHGRGRADILPAGHDGDRRHHRHAGLTHGDDVGVGAQKMQEIDDVVDVVVQIEHVGHDRHVAAIDPVGDVDVMVRQHGLDRAAQQGREMSRQGGRDQNLGIVAVGLALEMDQIAIGPVDRHLDLDRHFLAVDHRMVDAPFGLAVFVGHPRIDFSGGPHGLADGGVAEGVHGIVGGKLKRIRHGP